MADVLVVEPEPVATASAATGFLASTGSNLATAGLAFVSGVIVTRALGPSGRGELSFVLNALGLVVMVGGAGSFAAITSVARHTGIRAGDMYAGAAVVALAGAAVAGALLLAGYHLLEASLFSGVSASQIAWVLVAAGPALVLNWWSGIAATDGRLVRFAAGVCAGAVVYLGGVLVLAAVGALRLSTVLPLWVLASFVPALAVVDRFGAGSLHRVGSIARHLGRSALRANPGDLAMLLVLRIDVFLVKGFRGFRELGLYAVAVGVAEIGLQVGIGLRVALLGRQASPDDRDALARHLARTMRLSVLVGAALFAAAVVAARPVVGLVFSQSFAPAGTAVVVLLPGTIAMAMQGPLRDFLFVEGRQRIPVIASFVALAANVVLNVALLRHHSYLVAAATSTLAYGINLAGCLVAFTRATGIPVGDVLVPRRGDLVVAR